MVEHFMPLQRALSRARWLSLFAVTLFAAAPAQPATFNVGLLSWDILVPEQSPQLGVNVFNIQNLTGTASLPPDFPVSTSLVFNNLTLTIVTPSGSSDILLGSLVPGGSLSNPALQFASNILINSAALSGTFTPLIFAVTGLGSHTAASAAFLYVLNPETGSTLQAGIDLGVLTVDADPVSVIPEPATLTLLFSGALAGWLRHRLRKTAQ